MKSKFIEQYGNSIRDIAATTGYSSGKVAEELKKVHPEITWQVDSISREIRKFKVIDQSIVDESLHRNNLAVNSWKVAWVKDKESNTSVLVRNPDFKAEGVDYDLLKEEMISEMKSMSKK